MLYCYVTLELWSSKYTQSWLILSSKYIQSWLSSKCTQSQVVDPLCEELDPLCEELECLSWRETLAVFLYGERVILQAAEARLEGGVTSPTAPLVLAS